MKKGRNLNKTILPNGNKMPGAIVSKKSAAAREWKSSRKPCIYNRVLSSYVMTLLYSYISLFFYSSNKRKEKELRTVIKNSFFMCGV